MTDHKLLRQILEAILSLQTDIRQLRSDVRDNTKRLKRQENP